MSSDGPSRKQLHDKRRACGATGKVCYRTRKKAIRAAGRASVDRLRVYRCPACGYHHLTSQVLPKDGQT